MDKTFSFDIRDWMDPEAVDKARKVRNAQYDAAGVQVDPRDDHVLDEIGRTVDELVRGLKIPADHSVRVQGYGQVCETGHLNIHLTVHCTPPVIEGEEVLSHE